VCGAFLSALFLTQHVLRAFPRSDVGSLSLGPKSPDSGGVRREKVRQRSSGTPGLLVASSHLVSGSTRSQMCRDFMVELLSLVRVRKPASISRRLCGVVIHRYRLALSTIEDGGATAHIYQRSTHSMSDEQA